MNNSKNTKWIYCLRHWLGLMKCWLIFLWSAFQLTVFSFQRKHVLVICLIASYGLLKSGCNAFRPLPWYRVYQKQPSRRVLEKRISENMQQIYRRTPMPKCNLIEITLRHWCSPVNLLQFSEHFFRRTPLDGCFWLLWDLLIYPSAW